MYTVLETDNKYGKHRLTPDVMGQQKDRQVNLMRMVMPGEAGLDWKIRMQTAYAWFTTKPGVAWQLN